MAFIATRTGSDGRAETLGVARTVTDPDNRRAELAILVHTDLKGAGLGMMLMDKIIRYQWSAKPVRSLPRFSPTTRPCSSLRRSAAS